MSTMPPDFTDVASVVQYLTLDPSVPSVPPQDSADGGIISALISEVSAGMRLYMNRNIWNWAYIDMHTGWPGPFSGQSYQLVEQPVTSIQSVTINGQVIPQAVLGNIPTTRFGAGYVWQLGMKKIQLLGYAVPSIQGALVVQYTAGYNQVPPDIQLSCNELVALRYIERGRLGVQSEAAAGIGSTTYMLVDMLPSTQQRLDLRKRVVPNQATSFPAEPFLS